VKVTRNLSHPAGPRSRDLGALGWGENITTIRHGTRSIPDSFARRNGMKKVVLVSIALAIFGGFAVAQD
jgi:hypothetical protein